MCPRVIQYSPDTPAQTIFDFFCRVQIRSLLITSDSKPVGVVSRENFLRWAANYARAQNHQAESLIARPQLLQTAGALAAKARALRGIIETNPHEVLTPVVSGVSSMQSLMADLLTWAGSTPTKGSGERVAVSQ
jgi:hypothetical protein